MAVELEMCKGFLGNIVLNEYEGLMENRWGETPYISFSLSLLFLVFTTAAVYVTTNIFIHFFTCYTQTHVIYLDVSKL